MSLTNMSPCSSRLSRVSLFSGSLFQLQTRARSPQPARKTWNSLLPREGCGFTCSPWLHPCVSVPGANHLAGTRRDGLTDATPMADPGRSSSASQNPPPSREPRRLSHPLQHLVLPVLSKNGSQLVLTLSGRPLGLRPRIHVTGKPAFSVKHCPGWGGRSQNMSVPGSFMLLIYCSLLCDSGAIAHPL